MEILREQKVEIVVLEAAVLIESGYSTESQLNIQMGEICGFCLGDGCSSGGKSLINK